MALSRDAAANRAQEHSEDRDEMLDLNTVQEIIEELAFGNPADGTVLAAVLQAVRTYERVGGGTDGLAAGTEIIRKRFESQRWTLDQLKDAAERFAAAIK